MKVYSGENIRNVAMVGHGHAGKTTLVSAMLYTAGATPRFGRVDDGSAITDYDEEEIGRKMSIAAAAASVEWGKTKINVIDTPGFNMFVHEARMVLPVIEAAIVVVDGVAGVEVVTQRVWNDPSLHGALFGASPMAYSAAFERAAKGTRACNRWKSR